MTKRRKILVGAAVAAVVVVGGGGIALAAGLAGGDDDLTGSDLDRARTAALAEVGDGRVTGAETGDDGVAYELEITRTDGSEVDVDLDASFQVLAVDEDDDDRGRAAAGAGAAGGAESAGDAERRDDDLLGETRERASAAAVAAVPGTVVDAEHADGGGYEVTVVTEAGAEFDIVLDESFAVVSSIEDIDD